MNVFSKAKLLFVSAVVVATMPAFGGETTPPTAPVVVRTPVTFAMISEKVITPSCAGCHNSNNNGLVDFTTYEKFMGVYQSFYGVTLLAIKPDDFRMPPANKTQLTQEQKQLLADYLVDGLKP